MSIRVAEKGVPGNDAVRLTSKMRCYYILKHSNNGNKIYYENK